MNWIYKVDKQKRLSTISLKLKMKMKRFFFLFLKKKKNKKPNNKMYKEGSML